MASVSMISGMIIASGKKLRFMETSFRRSFLTTFKIKKNYKKNSQIFAQICRGNTPTESLFSQAIGIKYINQVKNGSVHRSRPSGLQWTLPASLFFVLRKSHLLTNAWLSFFFFYINLQCITITLTLYSITGSTICLRLE